MLLGWSEDFDYSPFMSSYDESLRETSMSVSLFIVHDLYKVLNIRVLMFKK